VIPFLPTRHSGIAYFIAGMLFFSAMNVAIRNAASTLDPLQMVFLRNVFSFLLLLPFALYHGGIQGLKTTRFTRHFIRAIIGLFAMESWFYALMHLSVNTATALSFTAPLFSAIFALLFLSERIGWMRLSALLIGFAGVFIVANPFAAGGWNIYATIVLISASLMAVAGILVKTLTQTEPSWRIVLYMSGLMSLLSLPFALPVWETPDAASLVNIALIALLATVAQLCLAQALMRETIVKLVPFEFLRLIFTACMAWVILGEPITLRTVLGSGVIVASTAFIAWRESVKKRQVTPPPETLIG
jgi:drug/metabolite transporter (DMT)-like permease